MQRIVSHLALIAPALAAMICTSMARAQAEAQASPAPAAGQATDSATTSAVAGPSEPKPLLDENGNPFPPPRPTAPDFNAEIAASRFAELAMADVLMELALAQLVKQNGETKPVLDYAHRMVTNHTAIQLLLAKAAAASGVTLPSELTEDQVQVLTRLSAFTGEALDREYLWEESIRQPRTMAMYRWQYDNCDEEKLKVFVVGTTPIIQVHSRIADELHKKVNAQEIRLLELRVEAERKAEQERKQAEAQAAADAAAKKNSRKFKK